MSALADAAAALGVPEAIVQRSAEARAKATGTSVDEILAAWAGGGSVPAASSPEPTPASPAAETAPEPQPAETPQVAAAVTAPTPVTAAPVTAAPAPSEVNAKEALRYPAVVTVPAAGLLERTAGSLPRWLAAAFLVLPLFGLLQLASASSLDCGQGTELLVDRVTGVLENCDGSPFEGRGAPGGAPDFVALGGEIFLGQVVTAANCSGCHGPAGQGGTGPALAGVGTTFASCADHIEWVTKGSSGFQAEGRSTYGDLSKPITAANMPSFAASLSAEQIASVVAFERVRFGAVDPATVLADCGLVEAAPEDSATTTTAGEAGAEGGATSTTAPGAEGGATTTITAPETSATTVP
ncbi:MAG: cytochrome c [Actinobacteria bacterium]|nr:cytochrome c [Actinomycetota bacterium]